LPLRPSKPPDDLRRAAKRNSGIDAKNTDTDCHRLPVEAEAASYLAVEAKGRKTSGIRPMRRSKSPDDKPVPLKYMTNPDNHCQFLTHWRTG
jgi:hypothetical protein